MQMIGGVLLAIVILLAMVTIHEFGHYVAGKLLGFKINEFAVGFGPAIFKKRSKKTGELFALRLVPLGGYCAFDGEDEEAEKTEGKNVTEQENPFEEMQFTPSQTENEEGRYALNENAAEFSTESAPMEKEKTEDEYPEPKGARFNAQPPWKRIIVLVAGATMNYLLALAIILCMFAFWGRPTYQIIKQEPNEKYQTELALETYQTGLQTGDVILEIEGRKMYLVTDYLDTLKGKKKGEEIEILVLREGEEKLIKFPLFEDFSPENMNDTQYIFFSLGIASREEIPDKEGNPVMTLTRGGGLDSYEHREGFFQTLGSAFVYSFKLGGTILRSLGELITGKLAITTMGGPVTTITETAKGVVQYGFYYYLNMSAAIGVNLAVFNLLPVPALDGCKVVFCIIEWIRKKPVNRKVEAILNLVGIVVLFGFAILVDVLHFIL